MRVQPDAAKLLRTPTRSTCPSKKSATASSSNFTLTGVHCCRTRQTSSTSSRSSAGVMPKAPISVSPRSRKNSSLAQAYGVKRTRRSHPRHRRRSTHRARPIRLARLQIRKHLRRVGDMLGISSHRDTPCRICRRTLGRRQDNGCRKVHRSYRRCRRGTSRNARSSSCRTWRSRCRLRLRTARSSDAIIVTHGRPQSEQSRPSQSVSFT